MKKTYVFPVIIVFLVLTLAAFFGCDSSDSVTGDNGDKTVITAAAPSAQAIRAMPLKQ